jgi:hypothetical protein
MFTGPFQLRKLKSKVDILVLPGEQRLPVQHLGEDASNGPDVDRLCLLAFRTSRQELRRTFVYIRNDSITSGARYHLVATSTSYQLRIPGSSTPPSKAHTQS